MPSARRPHDEPAVDKVDATFLQGLLGYNTSRVSLAIVPLFLARMAAFDLRPVNFSVLSLIAHNAGITSRQLCATLGMQPPNLVGMVNAFEERGLIERRPHPRDGRAMGLHLTPQGEKLVRDAEATVVQLEDEAARRLSPAERRTLMKLLQKVYL